MSDHPGRVGTNIVGTLAGQQAGASAVLVGAHYDSRPGSPGADDNASGVAAMLECALLLSGHDRQRPVVFAAFDAEERQDPGEGLRGSSAFIGSPAHVAEAQPVGEAVILEMVGYCSGPATQKITPGFNLLFPRQAHVVRRNRRSGDFLIALSQGPGNRLAKELEAASARGPGPRVLALTLPGWLPKPKDLLRSDHAPFWRAGIPAVMVGDTANFRNPNYHLPSDTPDTLDYGMLAGFATTLADVVAARAAR
jgi:Zn-dependent M28 family amino/carboxypeptidase